MADVVQAVVAAAKAVSATWSTFAAAHPIIAAGIRLAVSAGVTLLTGQPDVPRPEAGRINVRQTRPARRVGVGRARASGAYVRAVVVRDTLHRVLALPEGEVSIGRTWLHDDEVVITGGVVMPFRDKRYENGLVTVETRTGLTGQTAYSGLAAVDTGWSSDHKGEGVPSAWIAARSGGLSNFAKHFPSAAPEYNREGYYAAYDWRLDDTAGGTGAHRRDDPTTWTHSRNWCVWFVNVLWRYYGQDWDRRFAPVLDLLTAEADICDEPVSRAYYSGVLTEEVDAGATVLPLTTVAGLAAGSVITLSGESLTVNSIAALDVTLTAPVGADHSIGERASWAVHASAPVTEPRYEIGFWFERTTPAKTLIKTFVAAANGHFSIARNGAIVIRCGHYETPTIWFGEQEIIDWSFNPGPLPDEVINSLTLAFTDPNAAYLTADTDPWSDADDIELRGLERASDFAPVGVQSNGQVRRLGKALLAQLNAPDGTFRTPLSARRGLGHRYVGMRNPECADLAEAVLEILETNIDFATASIIWSYRLANANDFSWSAAAEEGVGPISGGQGGAAVDGPPTIDAVSVSFQSTGTGGVGPRLHIEGSGPDRGDLSWFVRIRVTGDTSWTVYEITDTDATDGFEGDSPFVPAVASLDLQLGYQTGGGTLVWSTTDTVDTEPSAGVPGAPTSLAAVDNATTPDGATVSWSNAADVTHARVYHGGPSDSFPGLGDSGDLAATPGTAQSVNYLLAAGSYRIWVVNKNGAGYGPAAGPATVTVV